MSSLPNEHTAHERPEDHANIKEELSNKLFKQTDAIEEVLLKLNKANMLLGLWTERYDFYSAPDPRLAIAGAAHTSTGKLSDDKKRLMTESMIWFSDYPTITGLIDIIFDYVYESKEALSKAISCI